MKRLFLSASILLIGTGSAATGPHTPDKKLQAVTPMSDEQRGRAVTYVNDVDRITVNTFAALSPHDPKYAELIPAVFDIYRRALAADPTIVFKNEQAREIFLNSLLHLCEQQPDTIKGTGAASGEETDTNKNAAPAKTPNEDAKFRISIGEDKPQSMDDFESQYEVTQILRARDPEAYKKQLEDRARAQYIADQAEIATNTTRGQYLKKKAARQEEEDKKRYRHEYEKRYGKLTDASWDAYWEQRQKDFKNPEYIKLLDTFSDNPAAEVALSAWDLQRRKTFLKSAKVAVTTPKPAVAEEQQQLTALQRAKIAMDKAHAERDAAEKALAEAIAEQGQAIVTAKPKPSAEVLALRKELKKARKYAQARKDAAIHKAQKEYDAAVAYRDSLYDDAEPTNKTLWQKAKQALATIPGFFTTHAKNDVKKDFYAALNTHEGEGIGKRMKRYLLVSLSTSAATGAVCFLVALGSDLRAGIPVTRAIKNFIMSVGTDYKGMISFFGEVGLAGGLTQAIKDAFSAMYHWARESDDSDGHKETVLGHVGRYFKTGITAPIAAGAVMFCHNWLARATRLGIGTMSIKPIEAAAMLASGISTLGEAAYDYFFAPDDKTHYYNGKPYSWD